MKQKKSIGLVIGLLVVCIIAVCAFFKAFDMYRNTHRKLDDILTLSSAPKQEPAVSEAAESTLKLYVNNEPVTLTLDGSGAEYDCFTLHTDFENTITTEDSSHTVMVNGEELKDGSYSLALDEISRTNKITVSVDGEEYYLRTLPEDFPELTALGESSMDGYFYTTLGNFVVKFDKKGQVAFYRRANATNAGPFRRNEIDGEVIYSYLEGRSSDEHVFLTGTGYRTTALVMLNEQYQKVDEVPYMVESEKIPANFPLENHDYLILGKDHYILTTYLGKKVTNISESVEGSDYGANVVACIFQEVKDGEVIFEWDSTDHPELYEASLEAGDYDNTVKFWADYAHFNSIVIDPKDNNFVCSYRNLDSIIKIDRETGEILWYLGGKNDDFGLTEEQQFHRQHNATFTEDGSLLLFDNGCLTNILGYPELSAEEKAEGESKQYSRGIKITIDEEKKEVTDFKEYTVDGFYSSSMGSAQILDDSTDTILLGWGGKSKVGMPLFSEVNSSEKKINLEILCADSDINCYRVTYYDK
ncbi:MAG: aryl-sulfate sulfotransferase [Eubacteriales bacterium]|nr:aryl-sulfate sulfotransferase [Eubacteriales bacterium]